MPVRHPIFRTGHIASSRLEAFSDGVLAVTITLLVLELKLPEGLRTEVQFGAALRHLVPALLAWATSFAFVLTFWVNHHYFFASLKRTDRGLMWLNGLFLLTINLIPFTTALVGEYPAFHAPLALLSGAMLATSVSFLGMRVYASFHGNLLREYIGPEEARRALLQSGLAPTLYAMAVAAALFWPLGCIAIQACVVLLFFLRSPGKQVNENSGVGEVAEP